jgi:glutamate-5-semialdehyde dehydrogenase
MRPVGRSSRIAASRWRSGAAPGTRSPNSAARQAGVPVSLHGTGGAWLVADGAADPDRLEAVVFHSLDRKVCNTLNVCCLPQGRADLLARFLAGFRRAGERRGHGCRLHVVAGHETALPADWREGRTRVRRADGDHDEPLTDVISEPELAREWEWEDTPEVSLALVPDTAAALDLFNRFSPRFIASLVSEDPAAVESFYQQVDAPFVGDGFTRWVDGQYALLRPELGLSNWEHGRLLARGAILSGDGVFTVRARARQSDPGTHR